MSEREYAVVGRIRRAHGIRGEVVVETITDEPGAIFAPGRRVFAGTATGELAGAAKGEPPQALLVQRSSPFKGGLIITFEGFPDRTFAERWRDRYLLLPNE